MSCCGDQNNVWFKNVLQNNIEYIQQNSKRYACKYDTINVNEHTPGLAAIHYSILAKNVDMFTVLFKYESKCLTKTQLTFTINEQQYILENRSNILHLALACDNLDIINYILNETDQMQYYCMANSGCQLILDVFLCCCSPKTLHQLIDIEILCKLFNQMANSSESSYNCLVRAARCNQLHVFQYFAEEFENLSHSLKYNIYSFLHKKYNNLPIAYHAKKIEQKNKEYPLTTAIENLIMICDAYINVSTKRKFQQRNISIAEINVISDTTMNLSEKQQIQKNQMLLSDLLSMDHLSKSNFSVQISARNKFK